LNARSVISNRNEGSGVKDKLGLPPLAPIQLSTKDLLKFTKPLIRPCSPTLALSFVFSNSPCLHPFIDSVEPYVNESQVFPSHTKNLTSTTLIIRGRIYSAELLVQYADSGTANISLIYHANFPRIFSATDAPIPSHFSLTL